MTNPILHIYQVLFDHFGPQHWWPGDSPFEVMIGAVLTQNTNWTNVSRAIDNLKTAGMLSFTALDAAPHDVVARQIRPSGYYNLKAVRLKNLLGHIRKQAGSLEDFFKEDTGTLRKNLLSVKGVGPETADSILLYAANKPVFVVDAYTHRILHRHSLIPSESDYHELQELFLDSLPEDVSLFNEYHALLVRLGKEFCKKTKPLCASCPLQGI